MTNTISFKDVTAKQQYLICCFLQTAKVNGLRYLDAALPLGHPMMLDKKVRQIRKVTDVLACGIDELGNIVVLGRDGFVKQID